MYNPFDVELLAYKKMKITQKTQNQYEETKDQSDPASTDSKTLKLHQDVLNQLKEDRQDGSY